ncbi:MAG: hypothetical protein GY869_04695 [Planctomycetes bacterium]|nr:hypothetical protein [Planctomycetota bacterium]
METLSISEAHHRLSEIYKRVVTQNDRFKLRDRDGDMILISSHEWESMQETLRLLHDKEALKALLQSFVEHDQGRKSGRSFEEVFAKML